MTGSISSKFSRYVPTRMRQTSGLPGLTTGARPLMPDPRRRVSKTAPTASWTLRSTLSSRSSSKSRTCSASHVLHYRTGGVVGRWCGEDRGCGTAEVLCRQRTPSVGANSESAGRENIRFRSQAEGCGLVYMCAEVENKDKSGSAVGGGVGELWTEDVDRGGSILANFRKQQQQYVHDAHFRCATLYRTVTTSTLRCM